MTPVAALVKSPEPAAVRRISKEAFGSVNAPRRIITPLLTRLAVRLVMITPPPVPPTNVPVLITVGAKTFTFALVATNVPPRFANVPPEKLPPELWMNPPVLFVTDRAKVPPVFVMLPAFHTCSATVPELTMIPELVSTVTPPPTVPNWPPALAISPELFQFATPRFSVPPLVILMVPRLLTASPVPLVAISKVPAGATSVPLVSLYSPDEYSPGPVNSP